ncbi:hypothetical protein [Desulfonema magnum]|uniref:ScoMcrA-like DNA sulfur-binding domain-containing protein n=1 Tax=Desulfonema magnum TaxID=45655 RepID=A0A975BQ93_9BACT|nr:hypothetical protein [Desulfonema magnum]QTA89692.1 Uncharacterized protein dnm_057490 [Desulfonema magnum]
MDKNIVKEKFSKITLWKRSGERAPHKPLLILYALGRLLWDKERLIPYEDIDNEVVKLLRDFGPDRASYRPEYPFWRLQKDQIWEVVNAENIELTKSGDPKKSDLIGSHVKGGFSEVIFQELQKDYQLFQDIIQELLYANFSETVHENILQSVGIDIDQPFVNDKKTETI